MTAAEIVAAALEFYGVSKARLTNHSNRDADEMDCRAAIAFLLNARLGYSPRRAAKAVGYLESTLGASWDRLRLRVLESARLRSQIDRICPETKARAA